MLQLVDIKKDYAAGENTVHALRGISLDFRKSDFVSILGPSGCGKTTMLNIIGGLDQYTEGDLIIDGISTKDYKDRDWDSYRNHSVGFVFQSYNLIPHQTVLQNVEIALTLSGVKKKERRRRAIEALEAVGLGDQLKKRPSEMSGGQMQRVAIARALVNNPDIILADEPTGALDTETSVQVMEILKEIAKDRLVVMVTHNPELAEKYSTRIIRMLDGQITHDSAPLNRQELEEGLKDRKTVEEKKKEKMPSMSLFTSFGLSLKNLFTKKGRTILTSFAGSIGIIGIALIWAVSQGMHMYINAVQEDTLSSYPLTLEATTVDLGTLMNTFMGIGKDKQPHDKDAVYAQSVLYDMINALNNMDSTENDLKSFKVYMEDQLKDPDSKLSEAVNGIQYTYDLDLLVYTKNVDGEIIRSDVQQILMDAIQRNLGSDMSSMLSMSESMGGGMMDPSAMMPGMTVWSEILSAKDGALINPLLYEQYELIDGGRWPAAYNEVVLVVNEENELSDLTLYALGLKSKAEMDQMFDAVKNGTELPTDQKKWTYDEIKAMEFKVILNSECYKQNQDGSYTDMREDPTGLSLLYNQGIDLKVTGIIRPREDAASNMLSGSIAYTKALTEHVINAMHDSAAIDAQLANKDTDIFTGLPFRPAEGTMTDEQKETEFRAYMETLDDAQKVEAYIKIKGIPTDEELMAAVQQRLTAMTREQKIEALRNAMQQQNMPLDALDSAVKDIAEEELNNMVIPVLQAMISMEMAQTAAQQYGAMPPQDILTNLAKELPQYTTAQCAKYYMELVKFSESTYEDNLVTLGYLDLTSPATMNLYASSFENKEVIEDAIASYNKSVDELKQIRYTDYVGIMMSSITTIIDAITYVLIGFVAISLVVSSIMIGVITLISVQERTKEIGILRAIGASKGNVSSMFNAETVIIGFASGLLGIILTYLLCIPLNAIIYSLTDIPNLRAHLPVNVAVILVIVSIVLNLISGIIPSRSAAKKDPVVALRTE